MKTQAIKIALNEYKFDLAFGGARRDEEKSRAKERIFLLISHSWDPKTKDLNFGITSTLERKKESQLEYSHYLIGQN